MLVGLGIDIVELSRIRQAYEKFGNRFLKRILTDSEIASMPPNSIPWLAGRFAGKEAAAKALGTGFCHGITFADFEILNMSSGQPGLSFSGIAAEQALFMGVSKIHISITHERSCAASVVILEE